MANAKVPETLKYEDVLHRLGNFGRYQLFVFLWYTAVVFMNASYFGYMSFGGAVPAIHCPNGTNITAECNQTIQFYSIVDEWNLLDDRTYLAEMASSVQMAGQFVGPIFAGQLSDRFGRKKTFILFFNCLLVSGILSSLSYNLTMFIVFRFLCGFSMTAVSAVHYVWYVEFMPEKQRIFNNIGSYGLGYLWLALLAYTSPSWRLLGYLINVPFALALPMSLLLCESPKWLLQRGRREEAYKVFGTVAKWNGKSGDALNFDVESAPASNSNRTYSYWHIFYSKRASINAVCLAIAWVVASCVYFGIYYNLSYLGGNLFINFAAVNFFRIFFNVLNVIADRQLPWFGRKLTNILGYGGCLFSLIGVALCYALPTSYTDKILIVLTIFGLSFGAGRAWLASEVLTAELFPTELRTLSYGFCSVMSRIGGIIGPQVFLLYASWHAAPYVVYAGISGIALAAVLVLPETKGKPLPDLPASMCGTQYESL